MNRKRLFLLVAFLVLVVIWIVVTFNIRAEPVTAISDKWTGSGHAEGTSESFVHWDEDDPPVVPIACAKCHSTYGYLDFLGEDGSMAGSVDGEAKTGSVLYCNVCHNTRAHEKNEVMFPSGVTVSGVGAEGTCFECHQGRQSTVSVNEALGGLPDDEVAADLGFINVHYYVAAATQMGGEVRGAYEYEGQNYVGRFEHAPGLVTCHQCHDPHSLALTADECSPCHLNVVDHEDLQDIRAHELDYDGDGDVSEGVRAEIGLLHETLYVAIQTYATSVIENPIVYSESSFPYFMVDTDGDGQVGPDEANFGNRYLSWTPRLVRAAYNYHYVAKDPGAFAHNPAYVTQILYDTLADLNQVVPVDVSSFARPPVTGDGN